MEVAESAAGLLIYKELDYSYIDGEKIVSSISSAWRSTPKRKVKPHIIYFK
jgi:hypothetical protein